MEIMDTLQRKGFERGIQQGKHEEALEIAHNMFLKKLNVKLIQEVTGLSDEELTRLMQTH
jgi:predicted transposase/invertase (TIGR01784 family)